jgi:hypothetical protein
MTSIVVHTMPFWLLVLFFLAAFFAGIAGKND